MSKGLGNTQKKILTLIMGGIGAGLTRNANKQIRIIKNTCHELHELGKPNSERALTSLEKHKLIRLVQKRGGLEPRLTREGRRQAFLAALDDIEITPQKRWDGKWRVVSFDIPEEERGKRNGFRGHLQRLGFYEIHQSLFVVPWPCEDEIRLIAHQLNVNEYVHTLIAETIDHEKRIKKLFGVSA